MKKGIALLLIALMLVSFVGCGLLNEDDDDYEEDAYEKEEVSISNLSFSGSGAHATTLSSGSQGAAMSVSGNSGTLTITRPELSSGGSVGDAGLWTIFVYLCGTDLESDGGGASDDLKEMTDGADGSGVRFIVETGGTEEWWNDTVKRDRLQRYLIENGKMTLVDEQPLAGMGRQKTLSDFLSWGTANYSSEHMGVVLWNHGGGSITGVCFDERDDNKSLSLRELGGALQDTCKGMGRKFDFIGFDACLMGTLESANVLASYADYMVASEELEPGSGWDYEAIGRFLTKNRNADTVSLGKKICDSFQDACNAADDGDICTLSVIDLSKLDALLVAFNDFAHEIYDAAADTEICAEIVRGIRKADNFGGNNKSEGYTNMVDLGGIVSAGAKYGANADNTLSKLKDAVVYSVSGKTHSGASGLAMYYPLQVEGSQELSIFSEICPSPYYVSFVDRQNHGSINANYAEEYDDSEWFDDDGDWSWGLFGFLFGDDDDYDDYDDYGYYDDYDDYDYYDDYGYYDDYDDYGYYDDYDDYGYYDDYDDYGCGDYWSYLDGYRQSDKSTLITFKEKPHIDKDGIFRFTLDEKGLSYAAEVYGVVYVLSPDEENLIELGETYDMESNWKTGEFADAFDGYWISLPDGQNLATYIVEDTKDFTIYTSPVLLNGKETNLRLKLDYKAESMIIEGAWDGLTDQGAAVRNIVKLKTGDVITPLYYSYALDSDEESRYYGQEYSFTGTPEIYYDLLENGDYYYAICIDDIYGNYYMTDVVEFEVEDGEVWLIQEDEETDSESNAA